METHHIGANTTKSQDIEETMSWDNTWMFLPHFDTRSWVSKKSGVNGLFSAHAAQPVGSHRGRDCGSYFGTKAGVIGVCLVLGESEDFLNGHAHA